MLRSIPQRPPVSVARALHHTGVGTSTPVPALRGLASQERLPDVLLAEITGFLPRADALAVRSVSKRFQTCTDRLFNSLRLDCLDEFDDWLASPRYQHVKSLTLTRCIDVDIKRLVARLTPARRAALKRLHIENLQPNGLPTATLSRLSALPLTALHYASAPIGPQQLAALAVVSGLTELDLSKAFCFLSETAAQALTTFPSLKTLSTRLSCAGPETHTALLALSSSQTLETCRLQTASASLALHPLHACVSLHTVAIDADNGVDDDTVTALTSHPRLHTLLFKHQRLNEAAASALAMMPTLTHLSLTDGETSGAAARALSASVSLTHLSLLRVDKASGAIAPLLRLQSLTHLDFIARHVNDIASWNEKDNLDALQRSPALRTVTIDQRQLSANAALKLAALAQIERLALTMNDVSASMRSAIDASWRRHHRHGGGVSVYGPASVNRPGINGPAALNPARA